MVATFKGAQHRRRRSTVSTEDELQTPLEDLMFSPYKRRKLQKQKATQDADLAKLKHAAQYFDLIDSVKLETTSAKAGDDGKSVDVDSKVDASSSATSTPATTPVKQQPQADTVRGSS